MSFDIDASRSAANSSVWLLNLSDLPKTFAKSERKIVILEPVVPSVDDDIPEDIEALLAEPAEYDWDEIRHNYAI